MAEPFVLSTTDGPRWVIYPPHDPYGDGYACKAGTELHDAGMTAATLAQISGFVDDRVTALASFVEGLAADWRGWGGTRTWRSMDRQLALDAEHDGRGHVSFGVTLRAPRPTWDHTAWSARSVIVLEAGEEMTRLAADLTHFLRT